MRPVSILALALAAMCCPAAPQPVRVSKTLKVPQEGQDLVWKWSGDFSVYWRTNTISKDSRPNLGVYDVSGREVQQQRIWFNDASVVMLRSAAVGRNGAVAAVGLAIADSGIVSAFLLSKRAPGEELRVIQLSPFEGQDIVFGSDNTIWILGYELGEGRKLETANTHNVLRHYDASLGFLGGEFASDTYTCGLHPANDSAKGKPRLLASNDRLVLLLPACNTLVRLRPDTHEADSLKWGDIPPKNGRQRLLSGVVTADNTLYARFDNRLYRFNYEAKDWRLLDGVVPSGRLFGCSGASLIFLDKGNFVSYDPK
jgi:hypothetical protein